MRVWEVMCETAIKHAHAHRHAHTRTHTHVCFHTRALACTSRSAFRTWQVLGRGDRVWGRPGTAWVCPVWSPWGLLGRCRAVCLMCVCVAAYQLQGPGKEEGMRVPTPRAHGD